MNGENKMMTICCGYEFEYLINSPFRERIDKVYECTNCELKFSEEQIKIVYKGYSIQDSDINFLKIGESVFSSKNNNLE